MRLVAIALISIACVAKAGADERPYTGLPGVERPTPIVTDRNIDAPTGEPENDPHAGEPGTFRVGDWDVRVSGHVAVEVRTSTVRSD